MRWRWFLPVTLLAPLTALAGCSSDDAYPNRPILLVCPWAAGGGTDRVSRMTAVFLEEELGVPVNVINATGGAGVTGHSRGARARPDGYTLMMMTVEINMLRWRQLTKISWEDFTPLMLVNRDAAALFVREDAPWQTLKDLQEHVRGHPGELRASGTALGGIWHLALAGWLRNVGLKPGDMTWVPTNGAEPSLQALLSGDLAAVSCSLPEAGVRLANNQVRCLGVMAEKRVAGYETVPTFKEEGVDWVMGGWRGLGMPKEVPREIADRIVEALERIVTGETVLVVKERGVPTKRRFPDRMAALGFDATWQPPDVFRETLRRTDDELGKLLTSPEFSALARGRFQPYDFPKILFGALGVVVVALVVRRLSTPHASGVIEKRAFSWPGSVHFVEVLLAVGLYVILAEHLGFVLTAVGILLALLWRLGTRLWISVLVTLLFVPVTYHLFANLLRVPLPRGLLGW